MFSKEYHKEYKVFAKCSIAVIGLGYVGLPLLKAFAKTKICFYTNKPVERKIIGFDINELRIKELNDLKDKTNSFNQKEIEDCKNNVIFTNNKNEICNANIFIITVPTPINPSKDPDLTFIENATEIVGEAIEKRLAKNKNNNIKPLIIYESTVYPGVTEDICVPIIEKITNKKINHDFLVGYSPERINPGDKVNTITSIIKLTSGSNEEASRYVDYLYKSIIKAGTHKVSSIKIAEASKVIENTQRDLNIAFVNELAMIFKVLNISTLEVLEAAKTKWNFLDFRPGLVGGHCIGIDPYYLKFKSKQMGFSPKLVSTGRQINDGMPKWIVEQIIIEMVKRRLEIGMEKILILGFSYKENCADHRNSRVFDIVKELNVYGLESVVVDPHVDTEICLKDYSLKILNKVPNQNYSAIIVAVDHTVFKSLSSEKWLGMLKKDGIIFDLKGICPENPSVIKI